MQIGQPFFDLTTTNPVAITGAAVALGTETASAHGDHRHALGPLAANLDVGAQQLVNIDQIGFNSGGNPAVAGRIRRNGILLQMYDGNGNRAIVMERQSGRGLAWIMALS